MGNCFHRKNVLLYGKISEGYNYLQAKGKITCSSDLQFNVLNLKVSIDGNYTEKRRVWSNEENSKK